MGTVVERAFRGEFETHLTVRPDAHTVSGARLERWAGQHGLKLTRIVLDRGAVPDQPMLTEQGRGTLAEQRATARLRSAELRAAGFSLVRVKIEAAPWNEDIPRTADEAAELSSVCHFEHHVKLLLSDEPEVSAARDVAERHSAHLSRNARRTARHGRHERFVTQRCRGSADRRPAPGSTTCSVRWPPPVSKWRRSRRSSWCTTTIRQWTRAGSTNGPSDRPGNEASGGPR